jgi:thiamine biosynthesis protein ThiS
MAPMKLVVNGTEHEIPDGSTVLALLAQLGLKPEHVAVERNREIVPRRGFADAGLTEGDHLEIVTFVGGG